MRLSLIIAPLFAAGYVAAASAGPASEPSVQPLVSNAAHEVRVTRGDIIMFIPVKGTVAAEEIARIRSPIDGRVETVRAAPNQWFHGTVPLGFLASTELAALLDSNHTTPEETIQERWSSVFPLNPVRCPVDCYVTTVLAKPLAPVHPGEVLFEAAQALRLRGTLASKIPSGRRAWPFFYMWRPGDPFHRTRVALERVSAMTATSRLPFGSDMTPGTPWEGEIEVHLKRDVLKVPSTALLHFNGNTYLPLRVLEGISGSHETEIRAGVREGEPLLDSSPDDWDRMEAARNRWRPAPQPRSHKRRPTAEPSPVPPQEDQGAYVLPAAPTDASEEDAKP